MRAKGPRQVGIRIRDENDRIRIRNTYIENDWNWIEEKWRGGSERQSLRHSQGFNMVDKNFVLRRRLISSRIVRIGGRSKSSRLEAHTLNTIKQYRRENMLRNQGKEFCLPLPVLTSTSYERCFEILISLVQCSLWKIWCACLLQVGVFDKFLDEFWQ